jgi:hypothetical protein
LTTSATAFIFFSPNISFHLRTPLSVPTRDHQVTYDYDTFAGAGSLESSGCTTTSYSGGGSGSGGTTWSESENGGTTASYDIQNFFSFGNGAWSMTAANASSSGSGSTYQWQIASGSFSSASGGATVSGSFMQSGLAQTSYSYGENAEWNRSGCVWWPASGTQTASASGWSNSYNHASGSYPIPYSGFGSGSGSGSASGNSPFSFTAGAIQYSGSGGQSQSASDYSSYSSTANYTLLPSGSWQGATGNGWTSGSGFASASYGGSGGYSYYVNGNSAYGTVSGSFQESGSTGSSYSYHTTSSLSASGWTVSGWQSTSSYSQSYQDASGGGSFTLPAPAGGGAANQGFAYSGNLWEDSGQSASAAQSAYFTLSASGIWQQTSGSGSSNSQVWQSSSQWGSYSHVVNGVTMSGTFSQSASFNDNSSFTSNGSSGSGGQWIPSGSGSDTLVTSGSTSYSGSGSATGSLSVPSGASSGSGGAGASPLSWVSTGRQSESYSASAGANHTTYFSINPLPTSGSGSGSGGYAWQATSGSGTTWGGQSSFAGYSGSGAYTAYSGLGLIQGSFWQAQSNTTAWSFGTNDVFQPATSASGGFWQAASGSGTTVDSGGQSFWYSGSGAYGDGNGGGGAMSQSGAGSESFSYVKNYSVGSGGAWQMLSSASAGGASGDGWSFSSYSGSTPCSVTLNGVPIFGVPDQQNGSNSTSYSFQTTAAFNGLDWSETGTKTTSGSGGASDQISESSGGASCSASNSTSFSYTEHDVLDGNGTWQPASGSGSFSASASVNNPSALGFYGGSASATASVSQGYTLLPDGQWQAGAASWTGPASGTSLPWGDLPTAATTNDVTPSLVGLASWPAAVDAVWGMAMTADSAAQTQFALGNLSGPGAAFTSEKMRGADAVFGSNNVAAVFPVNDSPILDYYAFNGVSAGNPAAGGGQSGNVSGTDADVVGGPMAVADAEGGEGGGGSSQAGSTDPFNPIERTAISRTPGGNGMIGRQPPTLRGPTNRGSHGGGRGGFRSTSPIAPAASDTTTTKTDLHAVPADRIDAMVKDGLAVRSTVNPDIVVVADVVGNQIVELVFERVQPTKLEVGGYGDCQRQVPDGPPVYRLIRQASFAISDSEVPAGTQVANFRKVDLANTEAYAIAAEIEARGMAAITGVVEFTYHAIPFGAAIDEASQGNRWEATISLAGDVAFFMGPLAEAAKAANALRAAQRLRIAGAGIQVTIGLVRGGQGIYALSEGKDGAAGYFGEAFMRLLGASADAIEAMRLNGLIKAAAAGDAALLAGKDVVKFLTDHCFVAGTPILTPTGEKAIELFEVGDEILSRPEDSPDAPPRTSAVEKVFRLSGFTLEMRVGGRTLTTTEKHPFFVVGKGWVWAAKLQSGDMLLGHDGRATAVESVTPTNRHESLYNLRVAFDRTYFVGSRAWGFSLWAHNDYQVQKVGDGYQVINAVTGKPVTAVFAEIREAEAELKELNGALAKARAAAARAAAATAPRMKQSDFGWKVEDPVPKSGVPKNWSRADIEGAIVDYRTSIATRKAEQRAFEAAGAGTEALRLAHAMRITEEEGFLQSLLHALENRK